MKVILSILSTVAVVSFAAAPVSAAEISGNNHGVVKISSCADLTAAITNNHHGVFKIDGNKCDINAALSNATISDNHHAVVKITNVCGTVDSAKIENNHHGVFKIDSNGPCKKEQPTTVTVTTTTEAITTTPVSNTTVTELPHTGAASAFGVAAALAGLTYVGSLFVAGVRAKF